MRSRLFGAALAAAVFAALLGAPNAHADHHHYPPAEGCYASGISNVDVDLGGQGHGQCSFTALSDAGYSGYGGAGLRIERGAKIIEHSSGPGVFCQQRVIRKGDRVRLTVAGMAEASPRVSC